MLFNIGALHSQNGAGRNFDSAEDLKTAVSEFQKAAGAFRYILDNFRNSPSADISEASLEMLAILMLGQAQECMLNLHLLER